MWRNTQPPVSSQLGRAGGGCVGSAVWAWDWGHVADVAPPAQGEEQQVTQPGPVLAAALGTRDTDAAVAHQAVGS